jgi:hypothetical protein
MNRIIHPKLLGVIAGFGGLYAGYKAIYFYNGKTRPIVAIAAIAIPKPGDKPGKLHAWSKESFPKGTSVGYMEGVGLKEFRKSPLNEYDYGTICVYNNRDDFKALSPVSRIVLEKLNGEFRIAGEYDIEEHNDILKI